MPDGKNKIACPFIPADSCGGDAYNERVKDLEQRGYTVGKPTISTDRLPGGEPLFEGSVINPTDLTDPLNGINAAGWCLRRDCPYKRK